MKEHYAIRLKREIKLLLKCNDRYYDAIFEAKTKVLGHSPGRYGGSSLRGNEESMPEYDSESLREIILKLP